MKLLFLIMFLLIPGLHGAVHVFGDSHAFFCFASSGKIQKETRCFISALSLPMHIHWLGPRTMYRVGREDLRELDVKKWDVQEGDVVVYVFGEIDVRCHVLKQRDKGRDLEEIMESLIKHYLTVLTENHQQYHAFTTVACGIIPPTDRVASEKFPVYGTLEERIYVTQRMNEILAHKCKEKGFLFINSYSDYATAYGDLNKNYSDGDVHIALKHNTLIKQKLMHLMSGN